MTSIEAVALRAEKWKEYFLDREHLTQFNSKTPWPEILKERNPYVGEFLHFIMNAIQNVGAFTPQEHGALDNFPWYDQIKDVCCSKLDPAKVPDGSVFFLSADNNRCDVCFLYHKLNIDFVESYVINAEFAKIFPGDILIAMPDDYMAISVQYVAEMPPAFRVWA